LDRTIVQAKNQAETVAQRRLPLKFTTHGIKWRQVIVVAMIAVPWFCRDVLAGKMEQRAADAQQVLTEKDQQLEQQLQIKDQRDMLVRIGEIQTELDNPVPIRRLGALFGYLNRVSTIRKRDECRDIYLATALDSVRAL
jgi:hypothetical protein